MPWNRILEFTDPFLCQQAIQAADVEILPTAKGRFRTRIAQIGMNTAWMQRFDITLPQISTIVVRPGRRGIGFLTKATADLKHCGCRLAPGEIVLFDRDLVHHRSATSIRFGSMSIPEKDLSILYAAIAGEELPKASSRLIIRPAPALMSRLLMLHKTIGQIARELPDLFNQAEVRHALENKLIHAMVRCLADDSATRANGSDSRHSVIIRRFEQFLEANPDRPLYLSEICAATGVPERTLRASCEEYFGMGPIRYLTLRRMHLTRRALLCAEPSKANVTRVVTDHGFWELGRFSVAYRALFGESPSETLRRPAEQGLAELKRPSVIAATAVTFQ